MSTNIEIKKLEKEIIKKETLLKNINTLLNDLLNLKNKNEINELRHRLFYRIREIHNSLIHFEAKCAFAYQIKDIDKVTKSCKRIKEYKKALKRVKKRLFHYLKDNTVVENIINTIFDHHIVLDRDSDFFKLAEILSEEIDELERKKRKFLYEKENNKEMKADLILASDKNDNQKLLEIFNLYREEIRKQNVQLYYALLGWKDFNLKELQKD